MKFYIYTLGCKVNTYESNVISDLLINDSYVSSKLEDADIFVINTCTVTNTADNKSLKMIRQASRINSRAIIIVCGCMTQHEYKRVLDIPGVAIVLGNKNKSKIPEYIKEYLKSKKQIVDIYDITNIKFETMRLNNFDKTRAFVKIQDGCNNFCAYCIIPYTRGNVRSKPKDEVIEEITTLVNQGHEEIVLTGIHTGHYGSEFENYTFGNLLEDVVKIDGLKRLRISSIEITEINDYVLNIIKNNSILVDHMHIPLQSGSDIILKAMNRKYDKEYFINRICDIRKVRPSISITTDVIVGFPGEDEELFLETIDTIKKIKFSKIHVFPYSPREGTKSTLMDKQVDELTKKDRVKRLMKLSRELEIEYMNKFIGETLEFIPEVEKDGYLLGHTGNYLYIKAKGCKDLLSKSVLVKIEDIEYPYLLGKIC